MTRTLAFVALFIVSVADFAALNVAVSSPAEAAGCVRGVRGAACAGPRGAVAVRRAPVRRAPVRRGAVIVR